MITQMIEINGCFDQSVFKDWIIHRAAVLDLDIDLQLTSPTIFKLEVSGPPILVEALEIACSLGPAHSSIDHIHTYAR